MQWLFPAFLAGATAAFIPFLLHLLRRRPRKTVAVPSLRFLKQTVRQNSRTQRLQRWLVLFLRCASMVLIAALFARPYLAETSAGKRRVFVVVVDVSLSMQTQDRWESLRRWALHQIGDIQTEDRIGILATGMRPVWIAPVSTRAEEGLAALARMTPGWGAPRLEPAIRLAAQTVEAAEADHRTLIVLTDHQRMAWAGFNFEEKLPPGVRAWFPPPAPLPVRQASVHGAVAHRRSESFELVVAVRNGGAPQTRVLSIFRDGAAQAMLQQSVELQERDERSFRFSIPAGEAANSAYFQVALDPDELGADDQAYAVWQAEGGRRVLIDAPPAGKTDYLGLALDVSSTVGTPFEVTRVPAGAAWPTGAVAILRNPASFRGEPADRLTAFLRGGGAALVFLNESARHWLHSAGGWQVERVEATDTFLNVRHWAWEHALVADLSAQSATSLLGWEFHRGWSMPVDSVDPLALWPEGGAAIGETNLGSGHLLLCGFSADRQDGEWPARETFVPFVHRAVNYLLGDGSAAPAKPICVGDVITVSDGAGAWRRLIGPESNGREPGSAGESFVPVAPGVYQLPHGGGGKLVAVNVAPEESALEVWREGTPWLSLESPMMAARTTETRLPAAALEAEQQQAFWRWIAVAIAVLLLTEVTLANRTSR